MYNNSNQPCAPPFFSLWGGGGQVRVHSAQGTTQFVDHKLALTQTNNPETATVID